MPLGLIHFELFVRRHRRAAWALTLASERRSAVLTAADEALASGAGAVRVTKEARDPASGLFRSLILLERGPLTRLKVPAGARRPSVQASPLPACSWPQDLYSARARAVIGRVLGDWLARHGVTPFELLHRADLAEQLEACAAELSAAVQAATALDGAERGGAEQSTREALGRLARRAIDRLCRLDADGADEPLLRSGVTLAAALRPAPDWAAKVEILLDLISEGAPAERSLAREPLAEILGVHGDLAQIFGPHFAPGAQALALLCIVAPPSAVQAAKQLPYARRSLTSLHGLGARLALELHGSARLVGVRRAAAARVVDVLASQSRLWPGDPMGEINGVQTGFALLDGCGPLIDQEAMAAAEVACWARLSSQAFVDQRLACCRSALEDVDAIIDMIEIARGATAQAELGRRLCALVKRHNFEVEVRSGPDPTRLRLGRLAVLIKRLGSSPLPASVCTEAQAALRRLACRIDADSRLAAGMLASRQLERTRTS